MRFYGRYPEMTLIYCITPYHAFIRFFLYLGKEVGCLRKINSNSERIS